MKRGSDDQDGLEASPDSSRSVTGAPGRMRRIWLWVTRCLSGGKRRRLEMAFLTLAGTAIGVLLGGRGVANLGPLRALVNLSPALNGGTTVDLGPLGRIMLRSHHGLIRIGIDVLSIDAKTAASVVNDQTQLENLAMSAGDDLRKALIIVAVKAALAGALVAGLLVLFAFRHWRRAAAAAGLSLLISAAAAGSAVATYDERAVLQPRFDGLVAAAPSLIGSAKDIAENFGKYRVQMGRLFTNVSKLYNLGADLPSYAVDPNTVTVLHVSDLHLNPQAWDLIKELVRQFHVDIVADTGDISDHGSELEDSYLDAIGTLGVPFVYVRGNHDSLHTQSVIARFPNAVVLDEGSLRTVKGIVFSGTGDPRFTPDKTGGYLSEQLETDAGTALATKILGKGVMIAMVHDPLAAYPLDGTAPIVLAGHLHHRKVSLLPAGTRLFIEGSTGGSGLRALTGDGADPLQASILHMDKISGRVVAWDEITMGGIGLASAQISRHLPNDVCEKTAATAPSAGLGNVSSAEDACHK